MSEVFNATGSVQTFTVDVTGAYTITAYGASGGNGYGNPGGTGASVTGVFTLNVGDLIEIVAGEQGVAGTCAGDGGTGGTGGDGGSAVTTRVLAAAAAPVT